jgi:hypothetical protein
MKAIAVTTEGGRTVLIEVAENPEQLRTAADGRVAGGRAGQTLSHLQEAGAAIADVCRTMEERVRAGLGPARPDELVLEFGLKLAGETGVPLVTKGSVEGTFQVTAKWTLTRTTPTT